MYNGNHQTRRPEANGTSNGPNMNGGNPGEYAQYAPAGMKEPPKPHQQNIYAPHHPQQQQQPQQSQQSQQPQQQAPPQQSFYPQHQLSPYSQAPSSPPGNSYPSFAPHSPVIQNHSPQQISQPPPMQPLSQFSQPPPMQFSTSYSSDQNPFEQNQFAPQQHQAQSYGQPQQAMQQQQQQPQAHQQFMQQPAQQTPYMPQQQQHTFQQHPQMMQQQPLQQQPGPFGGVPGMPGGMGGMGLMLDAVAQQFNSAQGGAGPGGGAAQAAAALAPHLIQRFGVPSYFGSESGSQPADGSTFLRIPKHYFAVNHAYVVKKLALLLVPFEPFQRRSWSRRAGVDQRQFERQGETGATAFLPPRDDVNAPDLYIPVMCFVSYVLLVGFVFGTRGRFTAEVLAMYFSSGLVVVSLETLVIKLGLYLINAKPTPWLDVIAYRGYKFVGIITALVADLLLPHVRYVQYGVFFYAATAHAIFLMRSHKRIILPRGEAGDSQSPSDLPQRNAFLLLICVLQYPIYWLLLILDTRAAVKT